MKTYIFAVCYLKHGTLYNDDMIFRAPHIGLALAQAWKVKGYVSCMYMGEAH